MFSSMRRAPSWGALFLICFVASLSYLESVKAKEVSKITVDLIENGKEMEAIIDLKQKETKSKGKHHKEKKSLNLEDLIAGTREGKEVHAPKSEDQKEAQKKVEKTQNPAKPDDKKDQKKQQKTKNSHKAHKDNENKFHDKQNKDNQKGKPASSPDKTKGDGTKPTHRIEQSTKKVQDDKGHKDEKGPDNRKDAGTKKEGQKSGRSFGFINGLFE